MKKMGSKIWVGNGLESQNKGQLGHTLDGNIGNLFDIPLFSSDKDRVLNIIGEWLSMPPSQKLRRAKWIATVNPEFVMETEKDKNFKEILRNETSLNVVDGIGLVWAREVEKGNNWFKVGMEILRGEHKDQIASGADLMLDLARMAQEKGKKIFLLGGFGNRAEKTADFLRGKFGLEAKQIAWSEGEPNVSNKEVIEKINKFKPDILLVAYGMKKQEFWIGDNLKKLDVGLVMGVGRSFDYYSGELKRAPGWVRKMGMEWLFSLIKEPKRWRRQLALPRFVWKVLVK